MAGPPPKPSLVCTPMTSVRSKTRRNIVASLPPNLPLSAPATQGKHKTRLYIASKSAP